MGMQMFKQLSKYTLSGGLAAMVNFGSRIIYEPLVTFNASLVLAYFTGLLVNYSLCRRYVFAGGRSASIKKQYPVFVVVASAGLLVTYVATHLGLKVLNLTILLDVEMAKSCAHLFGIGCGFLANFFGHKMITFNVPATSWKAAER
jgi:putative flippase GtrA